MRSTAMGYAMDSDTVWSQGPLHPLKKSSSRFSWLQAVVQRSAPMLAIISTFSRWFKNQFGDRLTELGMVAALAAIMMTAGFEILSRASG